MPNACRKRHSKQTLSPAMVSVIRWLLHYPQLRVSWTRSSSSRPRFTAYWCDEQARQHMIKTCSNLDALFGNMQTEKTEPRWGKPLEGGTPRLTSQTFHALRQRRLVRAVERRVPRKGLSDMYYYQLTAEGKQAASDLTLIKTAA